MQSWLVTTRATTHPGADQAVKNNTDQTLDATGEVRYQAADGPLDTDPGNIGSLEPDREICFASAEGSCPFRSSQHVAV